MVYHLVDFIHEIGHGTVSDGFKGGGPKFSQFHAVFRKFWQNHRLAPLPGGLAPPPTENPGSVPDSVWNSVSKHPARRALTSDWSRKSFIMVAHESFLLCSVRIFFPQYD